MQIHDSVQTDKSQLIFLLGFMGTGKTYWGRAWASQAGYSFIDLDAEIEKEEGAAVADIFAQKGEAYFRGRESVVLRRMAHKEKSIIACGGGTPCFFDNMDWMNRHGKTVLLRANAPFILSNIKKQPGTRPLFKGMSEAEIIPFIEKKIAERAIFYNRALITIDAEIADSHTIDDIILFKD